MYIPYFVSVSYRIIPVNQEKEGHFFVEEKRIILVEIGSKWSKPAIERRIEDAVMRWAEEEEDYDYNIEVMQYKVFSGKFQYIACRKED